MAVGRVPRSAGWARPYDPRRRAEVEATRMAGRHGKDDEVTPRNRAPLQHHFVPSGDDLWR
jgi:hypothetical protein